MAIVKMDHVRLIAMTEDREEILRRLQRLGCVEIDQARLSDSSGGACPDWGWSSGRTAWSISTQPSRWSQIGRASCRERV